MKALLVIAVLVTLLTLCHAIQTEYFLRPNDSNPCPRLPCHTLSHNIEITTQYFASNARIFFLPGVHKVTKFLCCTLKLFQISSLLDIACLGQLFQKCKDHLHETSNSGLLESSEFGDETIHLPFPVAFHFSYMMQVQQHVWYYFTEAIKPLCGKQHWVWNNGDEYFGKLICVSLIFNNHYTLSSTNCSHGLGSCQGGIIIVIIIEHSTKGASLQR